MAAAASSPNVFCKLSGLVTEVTFHILAKLLSWSLSQLLSGLVTEVLFQILSRLFSWFLSQLLSRLFTALRSCFKSFLYLSQSPFLFCAISELARPLSLILKFDFPRTPGWSWEPGKGLDCRNFQTFHWPLPLPLWPWQVLKDEWQRQSDPCIDVELSQAWKWNMWIVNWWTSFF